PNNRLVITSDTVVVHQINGFKREPRDYITDWPGSGGQGRLVYWPDGAGVLLPTRYTNPSAPRYPVLYMHDGQNLFDPRIANTGVDWGVDEAVVRLSQRGIIPPIIVGGAGAPWARGPGT